MKKYFILFVSVGILTTIGCNREKEHTNALPSNWSSYRPETIPYRIRQQNFQKGNIIPNHSFESGKLYGIQSEQEAFNAPGWRRSGDNVYWVDINDSLFNPSEISTGEHAIKIERIKSDETEDAYEGVLSDFIKVIPGRYELSLDIKLKNIKSSKSRLGTRLYDAIDIRVIYYDKNKIEISPNQYSKHYQTNINTSNKWLSFAHFNKIDSLDWTTVFCESAYPPFPDGFVPDDTRYVKIFVGLKGSGTMWVDNINYNYTSDNFSLQERLEPYFMHEFSVYDLILPKPKILAEKNQISFNNDSTEDKKILLLYPKNSAIIKSVEFSVLHNKISKYSLIESNSLSINDVGKYDLIFSLGNTATFNNTFNDSIFSSIEKNTKQGYVIKSIGNHPNVVFVSSISVEGLKYGINTLTQLIDTTKNIFYNADITDWPDLNLRSATVNNSIDINNYNYLISNLRFNTVYSKSDLIEKLPIHQQGVIIDNNKIVASTERPVLLKTTNPIIEETSVSKSNNVWYYSEISQLEILNQTDNPAQHIINLEETNSIKGIIWKGTSTYSPHIDNLDYYRFSNFSDSSIALSLSVVNTPYELPVNSNNILSMPYFKISGTIFEKIHHINFELDTINSINKLKLILMSCYAWNTKNFDLDKILYKTLQKNLMYEGDLFKLISLSDKLKLLQWQNYNKGENFDKINSDDFYELVGNYRFEDKKMDTIINESISAVSSKH